MSCAIVLWCAAMSWTASLPAAHPANALSAAGHTDTIVGAPARPVGWRRAHALRVDTVPRRHAVTLSEWYGRRLTVHRYGSYAMLPVFAGEFVLGRRLLSQKDGVYAGTRRVPIDPDLRRTHRAVALGVGTLFTANTVTGLWNWWDARHDGSVSRRRTLHMLSMLGADAGFALSGLMADRAVQRRPADARAHRNVAIASMGLATVGATLMWF